jgi:hypothetical protein
VFLSSKGSQITPICILSQTSFGGGDKNTPPPPSPWNITSTFFKKTFLIPGTPACLRVSQQQGESKDTDMYFKPNEFWWR